MRIMAHGLQVIAGIGIGLSTLAGAAYAEPSLSSKELLGQSLSKRSAEWWQYIFSIPPSANPAVDITGENCVVGQRGPVWFLAGAFNGPATFTRTCEIPEGKRLFFPALNYFYVDTPGVCGQGDPVPVDTMRDFVEACLDGATSVSVEVDGSEVNLRRVKSVVFEATFPEDNIFDEPCAGLGGVPGGTYSPSVDEGYYAMVRPLSLGDHVIRIRATSPGCGPESQEITYNITIVPTFGVE